LFQYLAYFQPQMKGLSLLTYARIQYRAKLFVGTSWFKPFQF